MTTGYGQLEPQPQPSRPSSSREVRYEHATNLAEVLSRAGISILISTYQAGKLVTLSSDGEKLELSFHNYDRPMGITVDADATRLSVATRDMIWTAGHDASVAEQLSSDQTTAGCFLTRAAHVTGDVLAHEIAWAGDELWIVNTRFSCLSTLDERHSFVPRWRPRFVDMLVPEDRCHLNGLAIENGRPKYVTALAETNTAEGWRPVKHLAGCLIDVDSHEVALGGLCMPHSPIIHHDSVFLLNSGHGSLLRFDASGQVDEVGRFPGYTRGLAVHGDLAVVGLSKIRETSTFGGLPISKRPGGLKCGVVIVNLSTGRLESQFEFTSGVDEIFDVKVLPCPGRVVLRGPHASQDGHDEIWAVPPPRAR